MKGNLVALTFGLASICASISLLGEASSRGFHDEEDMTPERQRAQIILIESASVIGLSYFSPYKLGKDKYENQTSALNIFAIIFGLPVLFMAPLVYFRALTKPNKTLSACSIVIVIASFVVPFNLIVALSTFAALWIFGLIYSHRQRLRNSN